MSHFDTLVRLCALRWPTPIHLSESEVESVGHLAVAHGVGPWTAWRLHQEGCEESWAASLAQVLRPSRMTAFSQNAGRRALFLEMVKSMNREGLQMVALKGIELALGVYPSIELRPMSDLDVLVAMPHTPKAYEVCQSLGLQPEGAPRVSPEVFATLAPHMPALQKGNNMVELHFQLFGGGSEFDPYVDLANHVVPRTLDGATYYALSDDLFVAHLTLHIVKNWINTGLRLGWLVDLAVMMDKRQDRLEALLQSALQLKPNLRNLMIEVWRRAAALSSVEVQEIVTQTTGRTPIAPDATYMAGASLLHRLTWKLRRTRNMFSLSMRYVAGKGTIPAHSSWSNRAREIYKYLKYYIIQKIK